jgi:hypothetical protein
MVSPDTACWILGKKYPGYPISLFHLLSLTVVEFRQRWDGLDNEVYAEPASSCGIRTGDIQFVRSTGLNTEIADEITDILLLELSFFKADPVVHSRLGSGHSILLWQDRIIRRREGGMIRVRLLLFFVLGMGIAWGTAVMENKIGGGKYP